MSRVTTEISKGFASLIAAIVAIAGVIESAYPGLIPVVGVVVRSAPVIGEQAPVILAALAVIYAAVSSPIPWLRQLLPWKKTRIRG